MIPDIVVETPTDKWLLDAKYRSSNNGLADGIDDLHAYRDGLRTAGTLPAFTKAYVLCPRILDDKMKKRYSELDYLKREGIGLIVLSPRKLRAETIDTGNQAHPLSSVFLATDARTEQHALGQ